MTNYAFSKYRSEVYNENIDPTTAVYRAALVRDTSTWAPDEDADEDMADAVAGGLVEVSVASYARQTLASYAAAAVTGGLVELSFDPVVFAALEAGQNFIALVIYVQVGGDDTTPADDVLVSYHEISGVTANGDVTVSDPTGVLRA